MPEQLLNDPQTFPSDEVIFSHIGKARPLWQALFAYVHEAYPTATAEWRYYRDAKGWLLKVSKKSKTLCWVSLEEGSFRMTCYFSDKAQQPIAQSDLPADLKQQFAEGKRFGKIRAITLCAQRKTDLDAAKTLLALRDDQIA